MYVNLNVMMLPALEVLEKLYESSRAPKQTVDGIICIHLTVGKRTSIYMILDFEQKNGVGLNKTYSWIHRKIT